MLPPLLGGAKLLVTTHVLAPLNERPSWAAVPRHARDAGLRPGQVRAAVRELQGKACVVVGSAEEREVVLILRKALGLS
jgi:hypothetical protein